jgi:hypothetical protein
MIMSHSLSRREPERDGHTVTRRSPVPFRPSFHSLFVLSGSLCSGCGKVGKAPSPLKREQFPACPIFALPTLPERYNRDSAPRFPALSADAADATDRPAKSAARELKHQPVGVRRALPLGELSERPAQQPCVATPHVPRNRATLGARFLAVCPVRRCRSSVVEHSLGKGEVVSSILTGSTRK